ncbi:phage integrase family protein [Rhizobium subbaraonis]|uniref:Phage integrase family protein n=1 Tax=Rhizobium subbaraonis TaxID=908946 RepID=A0A285UXH4_9HYPH|nr:phage integrase family protein [Rhizobium subbaraonis]
MRSEPFKLDRFWLEFSEKSLTGRMADWTKSAGMPKSCTMHGLRKSLGKMLAETGSTTRQLMETLGHDNIEHAELYSREAEQQRLARDAMTRLTRSLQLKKPRGAV